MLDEQNFSQTDLENILKKLPLDDSVKLINILQQERHPEGFFVILPSDILDDNNISSSAKIFYGRIMSLTHKEGYCYATNKYLAEKCKTNERNISNWLKILKDQMYIFCEYVKNEKGEIVLRKIFTRETYKRNNTKNFTTPPYNTPYQTMSDPLTENGKYNNKDNNNKNGLVDDNFSEENFQEGGYDFPPQNQTKPDHDFLLEDKNKTEEQPNLVANFLKNLPTEQKKYFLPLSKWLGYKLEKGHKFENYQNIKHELDVLIEIENNTHYDPNYVVDWNISKNYLALFKPFEKKKDTTNTSEETNLEEQPIDIFDPSLMPTVSESNELVAKFREKIYKNYGYHSYSSWFSNLTIEVKENKIYLQSENQFILEEIKNKYLKDVIYPNNVVKRGLETLAKTVFGNDNIEIFFIKKSIPADNNQLKS